MAASGGYSQPVQWLAVLETAPDGVDWLLSAPIKGPADLLLEDRDIYLHEGGAGALLAWMQEDHVAQCWIHPSYAQAHGLTTSEAFRAWLGTAEGWQFSADDERAHGWVNCWPIGGHGTRALYVPGLDARAAGRIWCEAPDGATLLEAILRYNVATGLSYAKSPAATGRRLLREVHQGHPHWLEGHEPAPPPARENTERRYQWARPLTEGERGADVLVGYDKNAAYLGACSSIECGYGEVEHQGAMSVAAAEWYPLPGYYRVLYEPHISPLPPLVAGPREPDGSLWVTAPTLALCIAERQVAAIEEAYVWPRHHRILATWYARLRDARAALREEHGPAAAIALGLVKMTYTQMIAQLNSDWAREGAAATALYRPHWRHAIIAQARTNLYRALAKVQRVTGLAPFAITEDCAYFLVSYAQEANLRGVLPTDGSLGGFKLQERLLAPTAIVAAIDGAPLGRELGAFASAMRARVSAEVC